MFKCAHLDIAQWLKEKWSINYSENIDDIFDRACCSLNFKIAKWLKKTWPEINCGAYRDEVLD